MEQSDGAGGGQRRPNMGRTKSHRRITSAPMVEINDIGTIPEFGELAPLQLKGVPPPPPPPSSPCKTSSSSTMSSSSSSSSSSAQQPQSRRVYAFEEGDVEGAFPTPASPVAGLGEDEAAVPAVARRMSGTKGDVASCEKPMPTLSLGETSSDKHHCWKDPMASSFKVRGPNYLKDKKKVASGPYLFPPRGADLFLTDSFGPPDIGKYPGILGGKLRQVPTFIINFRFPWGNLVQYFTIPDRFLNSLRQRYAPQLLSEDRHLTTTADFDTAADKAMHRFLVGNDQVKESLLKLIAVVVEGPWIVTTMVTGKPAMIGNKLPMDLFYGAPSTSRADYLEVDFDVGSSSSASKRIVSVCRRYMANLTVDVGFVIQGDAADELPEQMMGATRLCRLDADRAPVMREF